MKHSRPWPQDFKVYTASTLDGLSEKVARRENVWCGWHNFLGQHSCVARLSPFGTVNLAIAHDVPTSALLSRGSCLGADTDVQG